ncbi:ABC transporter permease [Elusimicrobiota bacterium]
MINPMYESSRRIYAMFMRYLYLHKRSIGRTFELLLWPVMNLIVWGFVSLYIQTIATSTAIKIVVFLINGMIFWDIMFRSQMSVSISILEDIWTQNIINLLASPVRIWEWITATFIYGFLKTMVITLILSILALILYKFNIINTLGFYVIPLGANLVFFGWAIGMFTSALIIRWGHSIEALAWGFPFLLQPLSAIFYPLSILPAPVQVISKCLPSTYTFEGMRYVIAHGTLPPEYLITAFSLNLAYFAFGGLFFHCMYISARNTGRLARLGMD